MTLQEVPTLYPSESQFADPIAYLSSKEVAQLGNQYGIVKLVPPSFFKPPLSISKSKFKFVPRLQKLKELNLLGRCRLFFYKQLVNFNSMMKGPGIDGIYELVDGHKFYYYDFFIEVIKYYKKLDNTKEGDIPNISAVIMMNDVLLWEHISLKFPDIPINLIKSIYVNKLARYFNCLSSKSQFATLSPNAERQKGQKSLLQDDDSSDSDSESDDENAVCMICFKSNEPENTLLCDSCNKPYHKDCLNPPLRKIPEGNWYCDGCILGNGHYGFKDSSFEYSLRDFEELCQDFDDEYFNGRENKSRDIDALESVFWKLVEDDMNEVKVNYGADIHNSQKGQVSGFPTHEYIPSDLKIPKNEYKSYSSHAMNLNNLPFNKRSLLSHLDVDISGMTIPWIYIGSTFSTFCWHVEDQWTLSANYQHYGSIKKWYCIPAKDASKFEKVIKNMAPDLFVKQPDILHQLITLVSPFTLKEKGIDCYTANQHPGEYIITYPRVYHAGFNSGYNFNEAVNFTMTDWLDYGIESSKNYRKNSSAQKASVFDIWELVIKILKDYNDGDDRIDERLIEKCIKSLKEKLTDEYQLFETIQDQIHSKPKWHERVGNRQINYEEGKKEDDDDISCFKCKGFCTFFYIKHLKLKATNNEAPVKSYLPTPRVSPKSSEDTPTQRRSKRLKIMQETGVYETQILCIDDYLKIDDANGEKDELIIVRDIKEVKELVQGVDKRFGMV